MISNGPDVRYRRGHECATSEQLPSSALRQIQAGVALCVKDRDDPLITEMIARMIIKMVQSGIHDAAQLSALAITEREIC
jgi:hypothetical protein